VYTAAMSPAQEVPPITNAESTGTGSATITFHLTRDSNGNITAANVDFLTTFTGFTTTVIGTAAHIHEGAAGTAPPHNIVIKTGPPPGSFQIPPSTTLPGGGRGPPPPKKYGDHPGCRLWQFHDTRQWHWQSRAEPSARKSN